MAHHLTPTPHAAPAPRRRGGFFNRRKVHHIGPATTTTTTTTTRRRGGLFSGRRRAANHHTHGGGITQPTVVHHQKHHATIGDKISGALLKLKGTLTGRPGQKAAGTRRMNGTDGRGTARPARRRFF
ncbi:hypothetical protein B0H63DRAFT_242764 [Podospora didyma]|uniref:Uncharacterized protein n=1 Tax=Podospora didyma TaxID=330526 RepID=A0AAE0KKR3_9PEZI|nr:hypothetical protein B0H63DRAFT_242764 [Podospora didyma]